MSDKKMGKGGLMFFLYLGNILISAACVLAIAGYFIMPLWKVEASF